MSSYAPLHSIALYFTPSTQLLESKVNINSNKRKWWIQDSELRVCFKFRLIKCNNRHPGRSGDAGCSTEPENLRDRRCRDLGSRGQGSGSRTLRNFGVPWLGQAFLGRDSHRDRNWNFALLAFGHVLLRFSRGSGVARSRRARTRK